MIIFPKIINDQNQYLASSFSYKSLQLFPGGDLAHTSANFSSSTFLGRGILSRTLRPIMSQINSIKFMSGDRAGQFICVIQTSLRTTNHACTVWLCVIMHRCKIWTYKWGITWVFKIHVMYLCSQRNAINDDQGCVYC